MQRILHATFTVKAGHEERVAEMMRELAGHVRREPGNVAFLPYTEEADPRRYFVFEVYRDADAFRAHITADYGARFNDELVGLIEEEASVLTWLQPVEGVAFEMRVPATG